MWGQQKIFRRNKIDEIGRKFNKQFVRIIGKYGNIPYKIKIVANFHRSKLFMTHVIFGYDEVFLKYKNLLFFLWQLRHSK
jgi:hypothetical protein